MKWWRRRRKFITARALPEILSGAALARASQRVSEAITAGALLEKWEPLPDKSVWELVCEEIVDTSHNDEYEDRCVAELYRRGIHGEELLAMRDFAWRTAGWLNFEMMAWDWVHLNEDDIRLAIETLESRGEIDASQREAAIHWMERYSSEQIASRHPEASPHLPP